MYPILLRNTGRRFRLVAPASYQDNFSAQLFEPFAVRVEIALESQDSDLHDGLILPERKRSSFPRT